MESLVKILLFYVGAGVLIFPCIMCAECELRINEVNAVGVEKFGHGEFVEFLGKPDCSLGGYKLIQLKPYTTPPTIEMVASFQNSRTDSNGFFIFGGRDVVKGSEKWELSLDDSFVKHKLNFAKTKGARTLDDMFNNGNFKPMGLLLLSQQDKEKIGLPDIALTPAVPVLRINDAVRSTLQKTVVDALVYSRRGTGDRCDIFDELIPEWVGKKYVLREFDLVTPGRHGSNDLSLNQCGESVLNPNSWRLGQLSPLQANDCTGPNFIMEKYAPELFDIVPHEEPMGDDPQFPNADAQCPASFDAVEYEAITNEKVDKLIQTEMRAYDLEEGEGGVQVCVLYPDNDSVDATVNRLIDRWRQHAVYNALDQQEKVKPWEDKSQFKMEWISEINSDDTISDLFPDYTSQANQAVLEDMKHWFEWLPSKKYRCRICHASKDGSNPNALAAEEGVLDPTKAGNQRRINSHSRSASHKKRVEDMMIEYSDQMRKALAKASRDHDVSSINYCTAMRLLDAYAETKMALAFTDHPAIMDWFDSRGVATGLHHKDFSSIKRMIIHLSTEFHKKLLRNVAQSYVPRLPTTVAPRINDDDIMEITLDEDETPVPPDVLLDEVPISILLDSSTDSSGNHMLLILFQTLENNRVVVLFYRAVAIGVDESATGYVNVLARIFKEDGIYDYLKGAVVGVGTDGARVMAGAGRGTGSDRDGGTPLRVMDGGGTESDTVADDGGVSLKLSRHFGRPLFSMKCMPHRLNLAIKWGFADEPYMDMVEDRLNSLHNFYNNQMHKTRAHLSELSAALRKNTYAYNYLHRIRWISSEKEAVSKVVKSYFALVHDLEAISVDRQFGKHQNKAEGLRRIYSGKLFVGVIHFLEDLLGQLTRTSRILQMKGGTLIGKQKLMDDLIKNIEELKTKPGASLSKLFNNCDCYKTMHSLSPSKCDLKLYETAYRVTYKDNTKDSDLQVQLVDDSKDYKNGKMSDLVLALCDALKREVRSYFPLDGLSDFNILKPELLPQTTNPGTYGNAEIENLARLFGFDIDRSKREWHSLIDAIQSTGHLVPVHRKDVLKDIRRKAHVYWEKVLRSSSIDWSQLKMIKKLIQTVLVLPASTADVERLFSILKYVREDRRSRLTPDTIDHILRLYMNGPSIKEFNPFLYVSSWLQAGHIRTDDPRKGRGKGKSNKRKPDDEEENRDEDKFLRRRRGN